MFDICLGKRGFYKDMKKKDLIYCENLIVGIIHLSLCAYFIF